VNESQKLKGGMLSGLYGLGEIQSGNFNGVRGKIYLLNECEQNEEIKNV